MEIKRDTLAEAHEECVRHLLKGTPIDIETSPGKWEHTWEMPGVESVMLIVQHPMKQRMISDAVRFGPRSLEQYKDTFTTLTPPRADGNGPVYTYGNRCCDFPWQIREERIQDSKPVNIEWQGNGTGCGFDQVAAAIAQLTKNEESRRAVIATWNPWIDAGSIEPPCCNHLQFLVRDNLVHEKALFRSRDGLSAMGENLVAEAYLLRHMVNELNKTTDDSRYRIGTLTDVSNCLHLYWQRDDQELQKMKEKLGVA